MSTGRGLPVQLILVAVFAATGVAQQLNGPGAGLVLNEVDGPPPNSVELVVPTSIDMVVSGFPQSPFVLLQAPRISVGEFVLGPGMQLDIGPAASVLVLLDGQNPLGLNIFANTGVNGSAQFTFPVSVVPPTGSSNSLQAVVVDFSSPPFMVAFTAASEIVLKEPVDYGRVTYARGPNSSTLAAFETEATTGVNSPLSSPSSAFDHQAIHLARFEHFYGNFTNPGSLDRHREPTPDRPLRSAENFDHQLIKTVFGGLFHYRDVTQSPAESGFCISPLDGGPAIDLAGTRYPNGTSSVSPWEFEIAISNDSTTMAAVLDQTDPSGLPDRLFLVKLDGTSFTLTGTGIVEVTPVAALASIAEESMRFSHGMLYFVDGNSAGTLYRVPIDPLGPATAVALPLLGTQNAATTTDGELFRHAATGDLYLQAGASLAEEDLYRVDGTTGVITNLSQFSSPRQIREFGDSYDGVDGRIAVSPSGNRVAFVVVDSAADELYLAPTDASAVLVQVTSPTRFDPGIDVVIDLNHYDDDHVMFFAGTMGSKTDLYDFDHAMSILTNCTLTNSQPTSSLPISAAPAAAIDPAGYFRGPGRMLFARDGLLAFGSEVGSPVRNLVAIDYGPLVVSNVTGDEFNGSVGPNIEELDAGDLELAFAPQSDLMWFAASLTTSADDELFTFNPLIPGVAATQVSSSGINLGARFENLTPDVTGLSLIASFRMSPGSDEQIGIASAAGGFNQLTGTLGGNAGVIDGTLRWVHPQAVGSGFFFAQGTGPLTNPFDARLRVFDLLTGDVNVVDSTPGDYWIFSVHP